MNKRDLRDLPPTMAVVLIVLIVLGFAAVLLALGQRAGGISLGILGGVFGGVVAILRAIRHLLPPGRGGNTGPDQPPAPHEVPPEAAGAALAATDPAATDPVSTDTDPADPDPADPAGTGPADPDGPADEHSDPAALTP